MANKDNSERIERYLREQMTPEESKAFLDDLRNDKELREEAQMLALLIKDMKEGQVMQDKAFTQRILAAKRNSTARAIRILKWVGSMAAILVILFGVNKLYTSYKIDKIFDANYTTYDASLERGGDDEDIKKELAELYNKVGTEKDVASVITRLQTIYDNIQSNNGDDAGYSYYENDIAWYLALAYIKDHNLEKAKELLGPLAENGDSDAKRLLKDMDAI